MRMSMSPGNSGPTNLSVRLSVELEPEDVELDGLVIHGLRVDVECGETTSDFHPLEIEDV